MTRISFITGATGFIGANLVRRLVKEGHEVHVLVRKDSENMWRIESIKNEINIHFGDVTDFDGLNDIFSNIQPNYIFHLSTYGAYLRHERDMQQIVKKI